MNTDLRQAAAVETEWAAALYKVLLRTMDTPVYDSVCADHGRPVESSRAGDEVAS